MTDTLDLTEKMPSQFDSDSTGRVTRRISKTSDELRTAPVRARPRALPPPIPERAIRRARLPFPPPLPSRSVPLASVGAAVPDRDPSGEASCSELETGETETHVTVSAEELRARTRSLLYRWGGALAITAVVVVVAGVALGASSTGSGDDVDRRVATVAAAARASVSTAARASTPSLPRPAVRTPPVTAPRVVTTIDRQIHTVPPGATVTLIDGNEATVVGRTPISIQIDPSHTYDVVLSLHGHATRVHQLGAKPPSSVVVRLKSRPDGRRSLVR